MHADAACDLGKHSGIPTAGCEPFHGCAWWDAWGATPAGPYSLHLHVNPDGDIDATWTTTPQDIAGDYTSGPVKEFVVRMYPGDSTQLLRQYETAADARSLTIKDVAAGHYTVWLMELNDSGLSAGIVEQANVPSPPTPSPAGPPPTPTPSATPTPTPTTTASASALRFAVSER